MMDNSSQRSRLSRVFKIFEITTIMAVIALGCGRIASRASESTPDDSQDSIRSYSMLYIKPIPDEPNLNGNLYHCSLLTTNCVLVMSEVIDYYPQKKGLVIAKRRTSRSGHDLLYVKADITSKAKTLYSALDFGDAAFNDAQDEWAGFVRPRLGSAWVIVVARIGAEREKAQILPLPEGIKPGQIAWSGEKLMILVPKDNKKVCFEISPKSGTPEWKAVGAHTFAGATSYMMNKSEWLEIDQVTKDGKPSVEVASVWFTGDRNVIAQIDDLSLGSYDLFMPGYAFVSGKRGSDKAAFTVNVKTGEIIPSLIGPVRNIKLFRYPPLNKLH